MWTGLNVTEKLLEYKKEEQYLEYQKRKIFRISKIKETFLEY